jgi:hypothetical protein
MVVGHVKSGMRWQHRSVVGRGGRDTRGRHQNPGAPCTEEQHSRHRGKAWDMEARGTHRERQRHALAPPQHQSSFLVLKEEDAT